MEWEYVVDGRLLFSICHPMWLSLTTFVVEHFAEVPISRNAQICLFQMVMEVMLVVA